MTVVRDEATPGSPLAELRERQAAKLAGVRGRRLAHRLSMSDLREATPTAAELDEAHHQIHGAPRAQCPKCRSGWFAPGVQPSLFEAESS